MCNLAGDKVAKVDLIVELLGLTQVLLLAPSKGYDIRGRASDNTGPLSYTPALWQGEPTFLTASPSTGWAEQYGYTLAWKGFHSG